MSKNAISDYQFDTIVERFFPNVETEEQKMWAHVILHSINDLVHKPAPSCLAKTRARKTCELCASKDFTNWWFSESHKIQYIGSFSYACEAAGVDHKYFLTTLKRMKII